MTIRRTRERTMAATQSSAQPEMDAITEPMRRFSLASQKNSRTSSWRDGSAASSTTGSNTTTGSSSNSSRPSIAASGRRRTSLASFSSLLKKSKRQTPAVSEDNNSSKWNGTRSSRATTLGEGFLSLPAEIQTIILAYLSVPELLSLRQVSKSCLAILQANSSTITRNALQIPLNKEDEEISAAFLLHLYPPTFSSTTTDAYFLRTLRRKALVARQLHVLLTFVQTRVYMMKLTRDLECEHFGPYRPGLRARLYCPVGYVQHLLDSIGHLILRSHPEHLSPNLTIDLCPVCTLNLKSVIASYPSELIVPIYQIIQLLLQHFRAATRSPSSVTAFERKLRGWGYGPPPDEHMSQLFFLGGIQELSKIDEMQGSYNKRLSVVKSFADKLSEATRINDLVFPDIYKTRSDPVMAPSQLAGKISKDKYKENVRTAIEARANDQIVTRSLGVNFDILTDSMLASIPKVETLLIGPETLLGRRILQENLVDHERELHSPYGFLTKVMAESFVRMGRTESRTEVGDLDDQGGGQSHGAGHVGGGTNHLNVSGNWGGDGGGPG